MGDQLRRLSAAGQSIWLDNIRRSMFASGELRNLIAAGLRGMTSNPTIFEKAIGSGNDYDAQLRGLTAQADDPNSVFEALAIDDIRHALDEFRPLYDETSGGDGFVSLEVSPLLADDMPGTVAAAKRLWNAVDRPNLMVKIPATPACIPAIREVISAGINVNVTLIFSIETYEAAATAYIEGIEARIKRGEPVDRVASVASVFVSRIDTAVDKLLEAKIEKGANLRNLLGKTGVANLKLTYGRFQLLFHGDRFAPLRAKGARPQRPLWASTGTKNPSYSDLLYVETVIGPETVNTVPPATLDALLDHGTVKPGTVLEDIAGAKKTIDDLAQAQISLFDVTQKLQVEGVKSFADSYNAMLEAIRYKLNALKQGSHERVSLALGNYKAAADAAVTKLGADNFLGKLWSKDPAPWAHDEQHAAIVRNALGWLDFPEKVLAAAPELMDYARALAPSFDHAVVLGMGGSSLAPDILRATFGRIPGYPQLHILDSSDPAQVKTLDSQLDLKRSLFLVASKSGTTTEPDAFFRYFFERVQKTVGVANAPTHFIAITDPDTKLDKEAAAAKFRRVFRNDPTIGGRYSALSYFGIVPAALAGIDVKLLLDRGLGALTASGRTTPIASAPAVAFGAAIGTLAKAGRDKLTIITHPAVAAFGAWAEQLIAESTGKSDIGIIPVEGEPLGAIDAYGADRTFVYVGAGMQGEEPRTVDFLASAEKAGHPVIRLALTDRYDTGEQFALWEIATATAGAILGIDAFDQPNVQESKDNTKRLLAEYAANGKLSEPAPSLRAGDAEVTVLSGSKSLKLGSDLATAVAALFSQIKPGDYVALNAYIEMNEPHEAVLRAIRTKIRDVYKTATTVGFGPRFLHSTGQLHKGGPPSGVFIQITADPGVDLPIPGMVSFKVLERAQAIGDFESLDKRGRRGIRVHLASVGAGLTALTNAIDDALSVRV